jgi:phage head maturation protease
MGFWNWIGSIVGLPAEAPRRTFDSPPRPIDAMFAMLRGVDGAPVSRDQALSVPMVQRGRNLLCSVSTLPMAQLAPDNRRERSPLLDQLDPDVANVVTLAQTVEDLVFDSVAWWRVLARDFGGFPTSVRRVDPGQVSIHPPSGRAPAPLPSGQDLRTDGVIWVEGKETPWRDVIRFDSPNPPVRVHAARAIRRAILIGQLAETYANDPRPLDYFTARDGMEPESDEALDEFMGDWRQARKDRATGYVPWIYEYHSVESPSPSDLQLAELMKAVGLELANAMGIDPEDLGISTTSRTYANNVDRRQDRVNDVLAPYMRAVTDRLSMPDVTRRGYVVIFLLDDYLKANPTDRWGVYQIANSMGALTLEEIRAKEKEPPMSTEDTVPTEAPTPLRAVPVPADDDDEDTGLAATAGWRHQFAAPAATSHQFTMVPDDGFTFAVDATRRTVEGVGLPYGKVGTKYGMKFRFRRGSLEYGDVSRVKHLKDHVTPVGKALELRDTRTAFMVKMSVARGVAGDELLALAEDGVYDGFSVGVDFSLNPEDGDVVLARDGVYDVVRATLQEVTSTYKPAFDDARMTRVAATRDGGSTMGCPTCQHEHAQGAPCQPVQPQQQGTIFSQQGVQQAVQPQQGAPALQPSAGAPARPEAASWTPQQVGIAMASDPTGMGLTHAVMGFNTPMAQQVIAAVNAPAVVNPTRPTTQFDVNEPAPYRFDREGNLCKGSHDFSTDVINGYRNGDTAARERANAFIHEEFERRQFDVATGDVNELNPTRQRPDMYVDQRSFQYPVWSAISKGTLADITPFTFPKFNTASGLVGNHTEGAEPTSGTLTTTSQTVTPTAVSGKAKITRETWDQGGNPQVSNLIWRQMEKGWYEALEAFAVSILDAATPTAIALTAGAQDVTLDDELTNAFVALQYVRGGFSMDNLFTQVDLFKALASARDLSGGANTGRKLYPALGASNTDGTARGRWAALDLNGVVAWPAWALAASGAVVASSYLFDSEVVWGWASTPQKLDITLTEVAHVYIGLWGYKAGAITDITGVREVTYDPVA